jgi:hypothetical protein
MAEQPGHTSTNITAAGVQIEPTPMTKTDWTVGDTSALLEGNYNGLRIGFRNGVPCCGDRVAQQDAALPPKQ